MDDHDISIRRPTWRRVPWLIGLGLTNLIVMFLWWDPCEILVRDNERIPDENEELKDLAKRQPDRGGFETKGTLNLVDGGILEFRYCPTSDSGVEIQRLDKNGRLIWEQYCRGFWGNKSIYRHAVYVLIEEGTIQVISRGDNGTFVERLGMRSGRRLARSVRQDRLRHPRSCGRTRSSSGSCGYSGRWGPRRSC